MKKVDGNDKRLKIKDIFIKEWRKGFFLCKKFDLIVFL